MPDLHLVLSVARIATAGLAALIAVIGLRAYRRSKRRSMLALVVGAVLLASGYLAEGLLVEVMGWSIADASALEAMTTLLAVASLVGSLYLKDATRSTVPPPQRERAREG